MLQTGATLLRPYLDADLDTLAGLRNDAALQATLLALPRGSSHEQVKGWVSRLGADATSLFLVIADGSTGRAVGFIQLVQMDVVHGHAELGLALGAEARGRGHGAAAIGLVERHADDVFGLRKIGLRVLATNQGALRLYARLGYEKAGTQRAHFYHRGAHHDVVLMEKLLPRARDVARRQSSSESEKGHVGR